MRVPAPSPSASTKAYIRHAAATPSPSAQASSSAEGQLVGVAQRGGLGQSDRLGRHPTAGNAKAVDPAVLKLFNKLDCTNLNTWKTKLKYTEAQWDAPNSQTVACGPNGVKYVLDKAVILGTDVTNESSGIDSTSNQPVVNLTLNGKATKAFGKLTATQATKYQPNASTNPDD